MAKLEKENHLLREQLKTASDQLETEKTERLKAESELAVKTKEISGMDEKLKTLAAELLASKQKSDRFTSEFIDPETNEQLKCPVIQTNGVIRSLTGIINLWLKEPSMGQSNAFRMFQCPVQKNFTMIASFPVVDAFLKLVGSLAVDISLPVVFSFKDSNDNWNEFSFHEQLELIARLCDVYNQRTNSTKPPEQRNVSVGGISFLISMHSVSSGKHSYRLDCFGINNDGGGKVCIKVSFSAGWVHPFVGMDFPVDA